MKRRIFKFTTQRISLIF